MRNRGGALSEYLYELACWRDDRNDFALHVENVASFSDDQIMGAVGFNVCAQEHLHVRRAEGKRIFL